MADQYACENIRLYGVESVINTFVNNLELNRTTVNMYQNILHLTGFNATEKIFGADTNYSDNTGAVYVTAFVDRREQGSLKGWGLPLIMKRVGTPPYTFIGDEQLPTLRHVDIGVDADADRTILKQDTYNSIFYYADPASDAGLFSGTFNFSDAEMANLRRFAATQRGAAFTLPAIAGITYPFGSRRGAGPFSVKLKTIEDEAMFGVSRWACKITFVEDF
jgi:hypothetical protein